MGNCWRWIRWTWLRLCLLWWYHLKFPNWFGFLKKLIQLHTKSSHFSWFFWTFTNYFGNFGSFGHWRIFCLTFRLTYFTSKQNIIYLESQIRKRSILWSFTNSYQMGHSWFLRPIHRFRIRLKFMFYKRKLHKQYEKIKRVLKENSSQSSHNEIFRSRFSTIRWIFL